MSALTAPKAPATPEFDVERLRADFPILSEKVHGKPLVFLDSGASTQKPKVVIDAMSHMYERLYANVHRGIYHLSQAATDEFEKARETVARFLGTPDSREIVFTRNATEAINLVAYSAIYSFLKPGDEVVISHLEHHANIVPWQMLRDRHGIVLKVAPIDDRGALIWDEFIRLLGPKTKLVAMAHVSNTLGTVLPVAEIIAEAHKHGALALIDGSQAVQHIPVDVKALDADFYVFTGHKLYGPTGIGVLYGKAALLESMQPWQGGGDMILAVSFDKTEYNEIPHKFEAGTPAFVEAVGLAAAIDYVQGIGLEAIAAHEHDLLVYATEKLKTINSLRIIGEAEGKGPVISFVLKGLHPHDIGTILDREGIAVRVGQHCAHPVMDRFGVPATVRASFGLYNTRAEVDALCAGLQRVREIFG
ncbi:cysteine desulfurase [uncultured Ferrovibrio sp.]|jgi:cysteine desulfurase/selenocysteine lyase|uniref:cysteine desulfurase n=1 Tax=uncultured Ferrovibrio sp. TaxID=1576913 RepID=UPI0026164504|nr:cysteine desulfurase [uncultured Ferrovibrio sp.]